jgi:shikimate kinase
MTVQGVVLVGFMGAGKTAVGRALASKLGWAHVDTDDELVRAHGSIASQFLSGVEAFRAREAALIASLCDGALRVLSVGGGALETPGTWLALQQSYRSVWLDAPFEVCASRVGHGHERPLWDASVVERFADRRARYALASLRVDAASGDPEHVAKVILGAL